MDGEYLRLDTVRKLISREKAIKYVFERMRNDSDNYYIYKPILEILEMRYEQGNKR